MTVVDEQTTDKLSYLMETTIAIVLLLKTANDDDDDAINQKMYLNCEVWARQWCSSFEL